MLFLLFTLLFTAPAPAAFEPVTLCFQIMTDFTDPGGDYWVTNQPRLARGVFFTTTALTSPPGHPIMRQAEDDGCVTLSLDTSVSHTVRVRSEAEIDGITILSHEEPVFMEFYLKYRVFTLQAHDTQQTFTIPWSQEWGNLAVGIWAIWRSDMHLGTFSSRRCCNSTSHDCYNDDGTCDTGEDCGEVELYGDEIWWSPTEVWFINETWNGADCCASWWPPAGYGATFEFPAVIVNEPWKFVIAHELGHDMVEMRMGDRTDTSGGAPLYGCNGCYKDDLSLCDTGGNGDKGLNTREYQSLAAREGWADFYAAFLWNQREADCSINTHVVHDLDLDGDIDDNWNAGDTGDYNEDDSYDGSIDCEGFGVPDVPGLQREDPLDDDIDEWDWLEDVNDAELCGPATLAHVGTKYDWLRYFWDMYTDEGIDVEELGDLYVDACPTNWERAQAVGTTTNEWPIERFELSAIHHGIGAAHHAQDRNGQDH